MKKGPPGAVFVGEKAASAAAPRSDAAEAVVKRLGEIRITGAISGEQIEAEERQRRARKLRKTLREIEQLEEGGRARALEREQREKVARKQQILDEIRSLDE